MNNKKLFLINLIISFVLIVSAVVVSLTAGIKLGSDIGGGTQFEITIAGNVTSKEVINDVKSILKDNGEVAETVFVEDKYTETVIVVRIADKKIEKQAEIKNAIVEVLKVDQTDVSAFKTFNGMVTKKAVIYTSITVVCLLLAAFVAGWIRYGLVAGLTVMFAILHSLMLAVSLFVVTRLPITKIAVTMILVAVVLLVLGLVLFLEKVRENSKLKHNQALTVSELVNISKNSIIKPLAFVELSALIIALTLVCVPVRMVTLSACAMIVCLFTCAYSFYFIAVPVHEKLLDLKVGADKLRLSKNSSPAPAKKKTQK